MPIELKLILAFISGYILSELSRMIYDKLKHPNEGKKLRELD